MLIKYSLKKISIEDFVTGDVQWLPPVDETWKLNVNIVVLRVTNIAEVGEVFKPVSSNYLRKFITNLKTYSVIESKLWAIKLGLEVVKKHEALNVQIESDSKVVIHLVYSTH